MNPEAPEDQNDSSAIDARKPKRFNIRIDRDHFTVEKEFLTGSQLRQLPNPDIGPERDLFLVVNPGDDRKIANDDRIEMENGLRFYTAPSHINPGNGSLSLEGISHGTTAS